MNCNHCGAQLPENAAVCTVCGTAVTKTENPAELPRKERVGLGILGALVGALLGGVSIVLFSRMGYVAALSGVLMAFATLKGYELLARKLSKKGIAISVVLMVLVTFAASVVDLGLEVYDQVKEFGGTVMDSFVLLPELAAEGYLDFGVYFSSLGMLFLFIAIGAFTIIRNALRNV